MFGRYFGATYFGETYFGPGQEGVVVTPPDVPGIEWSAGSDRTHWACSEKKAHWDVASDRIHWTSRKE